jgi:hypothetical protein
MPDNITPLIDFKLDENGKLELVIANELWEALKTAMTAADTGEPSPASEGTAAKITAVPLGNSVSIDLSGVLGSFATISSFIISPQIQQPPCQNRVTAERLS